MIAHSNRVGRELSALVSTGILTLEPASTNTIPAKVRFSLDVRAPADATVEAVEARLKSDFAALARGDDSSVNHDVMVNAVGASAAPSLPLSVSWRTDSVSPAVLFHGDCIDAVRASAGSVLADASLYRDMTSGAGHDSVYASRRCPTSMIFVPSKGGVSHHPEEWTSDEDCALGADVLLQSVLRYDHLLATRSPLQGGK